MAFDTNPDAGPLAVEGGRQSGPLPFTARMSAAPPGETVTFFLRLVQLGDGEGSPPPTVSLSAGNGSFVAVRHIPNTVDIFDSAGVLVANSDVDGEPHDVHLVRIRPQPDVDSWKLQITNNDTVVHRYIFVVADNPAEASQPWLDVSSVPEFTLTINEKVSHDVRIANLGTGPLTLTDAGVTDLGAGFTLTPGQATLPPNSAATRQAVFTATDAAGKSAVTVDFDSDDTRAGLMPGHNRRLRLAATVVAPLWRSGDILVVDPKATDGGPAGRATALIRIDRRIGVQAIVAVGGLMRNPTGLALESSGGDVVIADSGAFGGGGGVIRVDRITGRQTPLASGGSFSNPSGLLVAPDGSIVVVDPGAFGGGGGLIKVDPRNGQQTPLASGGNFGRPVGVAREAGGSLVVVDGNVSGLARPAVIRVSATGQQILVSAGTLAASPRAVAVAPDGGIIVLIDSGGGTNSGVVRIDPAGGPQRRLADIDATRLTVLGNGQVLCTVLPTASPNQSPGQVVTLETDGRVSRLSVGALLRTPLGIAVVDGASIPVDLPPEGGE